MFMRNVAKRVKNLSRLDVIKFFEKYLYKSGDNSECRKFGVYVFKSDVDLSSIATNLTTTDTAC